MEEKEFKQKMTDNLKELEIELSDMQLNQFYQYMNILIEWNNVMNLTRIIKPEDIITKHFVDSLTVLNNIDKNSSIIDIGTGAGFPGIPIKIALPHTKITLLDSLNKRINFLNDVIQKLNLKYIEAIHGRAEDYGINNKYREMYDIAIARAVAPLNILVEYLLPFVKEKGKCICMKSTNVKEEIENSLNAIKILGGKFVEAKEIIIPKTDIKRKIIIITKEKQTSNKYPRKAGLPLKKPLQ